VELEPFGDEELKQALERRPAPRSLKARIMAARAENHVRIRREHHVLWMRIAASLLIVALLAGAGDILHRSAEDRRRGEEAKREVFTALRITNQALNRVQQKLATRDRTGDQ
jgi:hypothetical protein